ncbi:MAG TPA: thioredoxin family protein [Bryobacteraceae bacterium]|nr:thioredoxin family protein [Bryobacteraceae bacterium]
MKLVCRVAGAVGMLFLAGSLAGGGQLVAAPGATSFAPFDAWKNAVIAGDRAALARLYSTTPPAVAKAGNKSESLDDELRFWAGLRSSGVTELHPKLLEITADAGQTRLLLRIEAAGAVRNQVASMVQIWVREPDGWRITATRRSQFYPDVERRLPQPATPNVSLYPDPREAQADLKTALATAAREHKRVLVVFGANWCYDCHVLDATFHSAGFAPLVDANYVVVHISIGDEGKDNHDLADRLGVALDRGVPSLAVLDPDGKVVVAQKHGEFESTVKIGPRDVRAFLEKWKPARSR